MHEQNNIHPTELSPLASHFRRFCEQQDPEITDIALDCIEILVNQNAVKGDTCLHLQSLTNPDDATSEHLQALTTDQLLEQIRTSPLVGQPGDYQPLILDGQRLYLYRHWLEEKIIVEQLQARMVAEACDKSWLKVRLEALFDTSTREKEESTMGQKVAAAMALTRRLTIITGGPGTGKTTTVTKILTLLLEQQPDLRIKLAAPTGKAATRLSESINEQIEKISNTISDTTLQNLPRDASTIHRMLGPQRDGFIHNADNHLPCDCLLLDETSMIDQGMMAKLLQALPRHCRLIMLGDRDQLESVDAGHVLGDITGHGRELRLTSQRANELQEITGKKSDNIADDTPDIADHIAHLSFSHRFSKGGGIGRLAEAVNKGAIEDAQMLLSDKDQKELTWIEISEDATRPGSKIIDWAIEQYDPLFDSATAEQALESFESNRVLTALRQGPWGETSIGEQIEAQLCRKRDITAKPGSPYRGKAIIIRKNDYEIDLFNGDTGIFWPEPEPEESESGKDKQNPQSDRKKQKLMAWFRVKGELKAFSEHQLPAWQTAWTLTVHRSQGSQYKQLLMVLPPEKSKILSRELIYTGITRAQNHCTIVVAPQRLAQAIEGTQPRTSGLAERLSWKI